jgi:hypothetical protein
MKMEKNKRFAQDPAPPQNHEQTTTPLWNGAACSVPNLISEELTDP